MYWEISYRRQLQPFGWEYNVDSGTKITSLGQFFRDFVVDTIFEGPECCPYRLPGEKNICTVKSIHSKHASNSN